ncbi:MAG TPA: MupA/Atu3671 family FMN-dependent luciferase-like monooxygenase [Candidatus Obscuribacterales bacterium]
MNTFDLSADEKDLIGELENLGVKLSLEQGQLKVVAPRGALTPELQERLRRAKPALIRALDDRDPRPVMEFSLFFFGTESGSGPGEKYRLLLEAARIADEADFAGFWTPERHFHDLGGLFPNPAVLAAALAISTRRLKLRAGSVVLPLQDPIRVAEEWAVVDNLSAGRVELSFASGWHANDFALAPDNYFSRHELMYERLEIVRALWRGEKILRQSGGAGQIEVGSFPRPLQPELPLWLTAIGNPESYRRIGATGAHLLTALLDQSIEELGQKLPLYRQALSAAGHDPAAFRTAVFVHTYVGRDNEAVRELVREPFKAYLAQTLNLLGKLSSSLGLSFDPDGFGEEDKQALLDYAFERYFAERSLMGDPETCLAQIARLRAVGVQEIACLVDFGLEAETVLAGIRRLGELVRLCRPAAAAKGS